MRGDVLVGVVIGAALVVAAIELADYFALLEARLAMLETGAATKDAER